MANVSVEAVNGAQKVCKEAIQDLNSAARKLDECYKAAGQNWKDEKYKQLGGIVNDCIRALRLPINELFECNGKLEEIEQVLRLYDETNF